MTAETRNPDIMTAIRVHEFGGPEVLLEEEIPRPKPEKGQVLVQVKAAGVGPWDAWVRAGRSAIPQPLPLTPGSDLSGIVVEVGPETDAFSAADQVFGVTNSRFTGAYAEYAIAEAVRLARKPSTLSYANAASVPVVACTAWQMVFDHGGVGSGQRVLVQGAAGNVGAYAVQLARQAGAEVLGTAFRKDVDFVRSLGADEVIDVETERLETATEKVDVVLDTVGGDALARSFDVVKPGGVIVSSVAQPDGQKAREHRIRAVFFLVEVTTSGLERIAALLESARLNTNVGEVMPLAQARRAHAMLAGLPHRRGKIVLRVGD